MFEPLFACSATDPLCPIRLLASLFAFMLSLEGSQGRNLLCSVDITGAHRFQDVTLGGRGEPSPACSHKHCEARHWPEAINDSYYCCVSRAQAAGTLAEQMEAKILRFFARLSRALYSIPLIEGWFCVNYGMDGIKGPSLYTYSSL